MDLKKFGHRIFPDSCSRTNRQFRLLDVNRYRFTSKIDTSFREFGEKSENLTTSLVGISVHETIMDGGPNASLDLAFFVLIAIRSTVA
jgi:hypothetical protein